MELFSLLAKLTLDAKDYYDTIEDAQREGENFEDPTTPKLELDSSDFTDNISEADELGSGFGKSMEGVFDGIKTALVGSGIVAAIASIVSGIKEAIDLTAETADGIDKGSRQLGISTKAYQAWDHALRQSGASISDVKKGIINMQAAIKAADPATPFADAEDQVDGLADKTAGLSADAYEAFRELDMLGDLSAGKFGSAEELMNATLMKLAEFDGSTEDRGIIVRKLFGRGGDTLNALLDSGAEGVQNLLDEAENLGLIMSDDEINQAVAYGDAVANLNAELDALKMAFVSDIIPVLKDCVDWLTDFLAKLNPRLQTSSIFDIFSQIDAKALVASSKVDEANASAKALIEDLQNLGDYWSLDEQGRMTWDALAEKALELFPQLSEYIDTDGKKISGNTEEIERNIDAWSRLEKQRILSAAMDEKAEAVAKSLVTAYEKGADAAVKFDEAEGKRATAIEKINDLLKRQHMDTLGDDASYEQIIAARDELIRKAGNNEQVKNMVKGSVSGYTDLYDEAVKMREESDKMIADAESAQAQLDEYERKLSEQMGLTSDNLKAAQKEAESYIDTLNKIPRHVDTTITPGWTSMFPHATGSAYIPYDNYPALLHRGEKVLTATEARQGDSSGVDFSAMEDRIIAAIQKGMEGATVRSYLNGRDITAEVNRNNINDVKGRRFSG